MPHIHEKVDFTVEVFIVHKDKLLLRMHDKFNIWLSVGGHIELDEDPIQAALREVREEVGLEVKIVESENIPGDENYTNLITPKYLGSHFVNDTHKHIVFVYFATTNSDVIAPSVSGHERAETRWVTKDELVGMDLRPNILFYATKALEELGEK